MAEKNSTSPKQDSPPPLAQHRLRSGITLESISESTKISLRFLRAIENEQYEELPGGIFARSYLRQYASLIGFDEDELLVRYQAQIAPPEPRPSDLFPKAASSDGRRRFGMGWFRAVSSMLFL